MKKIFSLVVVIGILVNALCIPVVATDNADWYEALTLSVDYDSFGYDSEKVYYKEFYVSLSGDDENDGSLTAPFATIQKAQETVRQFNADMTGDVVVHIDEGVYYLDDMIDFTPLDSGGNGYDIIYVGEKNKTVLSAGRKIEGFSPSTKYPGAYETKVEGVDRIANLYVNGEGRRLAETEDMIAAQPKPAAWDIDEWYEAYPKDVREHKYNYYDPETNFTHDGLFVNKSDIANYTNVKDVMLSWYDDYTSFNYPVDEIFDNPENSQQYIVRINEIWNEIFQDSRSTESFIYDYHYFKVKNAPELMDTPGEFYFDRHTEMLYYLPKAGEDMSSAEVIVPVNEEILKITGEGPDKKVENITFENLKFSHTKWTRWMTGSIVRIGTTMENRNGLMNLMNTPSAAVHIAFAQNVNFKGDCFNNIGGTAIDASAGYKNSNISGCVFSDIGCQAVRVESLSYGQLDKSTGIYNAGLPNSSIMSHDSRIDILALSGVKVDASYNSMVECYDKSYANGNYIETTMTTGLRVLQNALPWTAYDKVPRKTRPPLVGNLGTVMPQGAWKSNPCAPENGEKSWVRYDFGRKYKIDEIFLGFDSDYVTNEEKSGYEVLLSNDVNFNTYTTVGTQTTAAEEIQSYAVFDETKYRYLMVRTLGSTPFALSYTWVMSSDMAPFTPHERCSTIGFSNNYVTLCGLNMPSSAGLYMGYVDDCTIINNEMENMPYSGIAIGCGGADAEKFCSRNNYIAYNRIKNTNIVHADGSGFYFAGNFYGSVIEHNYLDDVNISQMGFYADSGFSDGKLLNNVSEETVYSYTFYLSGVTSGTQRNIGRNMYANNSMIRNVEQPDPANNNDLHPVNVVLPGQLSKEAYVIYAESGLQKEFLPNKEYAAIADVNFNNYSRYEYMNNYKKQFFSRNWSASMEVAFNIIQKGKFGVGPGRYDLETGEALSEYVKGTKERNVRNLYELHMLISNAREVSEHLSIEETLSLCRELHDKIEKGYIKTTTEKKENFNTVYNTYIDYVDEDLSPADVYDIVVALEDAYNKVTGEVSFSERYTTEIKAIDATGISEEYSAANDDPNQDADVTIYPELDYLRFIRDAKDEYIAYDNVSMGNEDERIYIKGIRLNHAYYSSGSAENILYIWTPDDTSSLSASSRTLTEGTYSIGTNHWKCMNAVSIDNTTNSVLTGDDADFVTEDIIFASPRMVSPTSNIVFTSLSPMYLRSFSFIKCTDEEVRDAYGDIPATTADMFSGENTGANANTTDIPDVTFSCMTGDSYARFVRNAAKRYIGFTNVDFGTESLVTKVNVKYGSNSERTMRIYEIEEGTVPMVNNGMLTIEDISQEPIFTLTLPSTEAETNYSQASIEIPEILLSGKKILLITVSGTMRICSFGFEKEIFDISHSITDNNLVLSVKANRADVAEMVGEEMSFALITSLYKGRRLCKMEFKTVDVSDPNYDTIVDSLTMSLSDMQNGEYTVKSFVWKDMSCLTPLRTVVDDVINLQ